MIDGRASTNNKPLVNAKAIPGPNRSASADAAARQAARPKPTPQRRSADATASNTGAARIAREGTAMNPAAQRQMGRTAPIQRSKKGQGVGENMRLKNPVAQGQAWMMTNRNLPDKTMSRGANTGNAQLGSTPVGYGGSAEEYAQTHFNQTGKSGEQIRNETIGRGWVIAGRAMQAGQDWSGANRQLGLQAPLPGDSNFSEANLPRNAKNRDISAPGMASAGRMNAQLPNKGKMGPPAPSSGLPAPVSSTLVSNVAAAQKKVQPATGGTTGTGTTQALLGGAQAVAGAGWRALGGGGGFQGTVAQEAGATSAASQAGAINTTIAGEVGAGLSAGNIGILPAMAGVGSVQEPTARMKAASNELYKKKNPGVGLGASLGAVVSKKKAKP